MTTNPQDLFAMLTPLPAPEGVAILMWNGVGWSLGRQEGQLFREDGSGWSCPADSTCSYIRLPLDRKVEAGYDTTRENDS